MSKDKLVDRLRGQYSSGPNNEFGTRSFSDFIPPISLEAASRIETLEELLEQAGLEIGRLNVQSGDKGTTNLAARIIKVLAA